MAPLNSTGRATGLSGHVTVTRAHTRALQIVCACACIFACAMSASSESACPAKEKDADQLVKVGRMLMKNKQVEQAKACFEKAVQANPRYTCVFVCACMYV